MKAPGQAVEEARRRMDAFTTAKLREAKQTDLLCGQGVGGPLRAQGYHLTALQALGQALHPVMDGTSPSHRGFQEWGWWDVARVLLRPVRGPSDHEIRESSITAAQRQETTTQMRKVYQQFHRIARCGSGRALF